ncbi:hypothetical protein CL622_01115 [archaeon]|nr:hypothetical protein [archaeon]
MKQKRVLITLLLFCALLVTVNSVNAKVEASMTVSETYTLGEQISIPYTISSDSAASIQYAIAANCPQMQIPLFETHEVDILANKPYKEIYEFGEVDASVEIQSCTATLVIVEPEEVVVTKPFSIDVAPTVYFSLKFCTDVQCEEKTKTFLINNPTYIDYDAELDSIDVSVTITQPDGETFTTTLPIKSTFSQVGTYSVQANIKSDTYQSRTIETMFSVVNERFDPGQVKHRFAKKPVIQQPYGYGSEEGTSSGSIFDELFNSLRGITGQIVRFFDV